MDTTSITSLPTDTGGSAIQYQTQPIQQQMQPQMQGQMQPQMQGQMQGQPQGQMQGQMQPQMQGQPQGQMQMQGQMQPQMGGLQVNTVSNVSPSTGYDPNITQPMQPPPTLSKDLSLIHI